MKASTVMITMYLILNGENLLLVKVYTNPILALLDGGGFVTGGNKGHQGAESVPVALHLCG